MKAIRKINPGAYRQPRWHISADSGNAGSTRTLCGKDVAEIKGDRRGSWQHGRIEHKDVSELSEYSICATCRNKAKGGGGSVKLEQERHEGAAGARCRRRRDSLARRGPDAHDRVHAQGRAGLPDRRR